jgi:hypothetical protein
LDGLKKATHGLCIASLVVENGIRDLGEYETKVLNYSAMVGHFVLVVMEILSIVKIFVYEGAL